MAKKSAKPSSRVKTATQEPVVKHSQKEKAAIAASMKLSKADYTKSEFHDVMPYEVAKSFTPEPIEKKKLTGTATLKVTTSVAKESFGEDEMFMKDIVEVNSISEFNTVFNIHYKGKRIRHRGLGVIIEPQTIKQSVLDQTQKSLGYKMNDTTGGVQLKKFFQFFEVVD